MIENAQSLKNGTLDPKVLKINVWKDEAGKIWTLDHRRLAAFRLSGLNEIPINWTVPRKWDLLNKMTTTNGGTSIWLKFGNGNGLTVR